MKNNNSNKPSKPLWVQTLPPVTQSLGNKLIPAAGFVLLAISLGACEQAGETSAEVDQLEARDGYSAGYAFGGQLAQMQLQQPGFELESVFSGICDALSETDTPVNTMVICAALQEDEIEAEMSSPQIPARSRGFKDDFAALNARREGVIVLPSGVQYEVLQAGSGKQPQAPDAVLINYQGSLTNGTVFDTTYEDGEPMRMQLDEIAVPGLKQVLLLMKEGARWRVVIPPKMGFAASGNNQLRRRDLIYEIELISIEGPGPEPTL